MDCRRHRYSRGRFATGSPAVGSSSSLPLGFSADLVQSHAAHEAVRPLSMVKNWASPPRGFEQHRVGSGVPRLDVQRRHRPANRAERRRASRWAATSSSSRIGAALRSAALQPGAWPGRCAISSAFCSPVEHSAAGRPLARCTTARSLLVGSDRGATGPPCPGRARPRPRRYACPPPPAPVPGPANAPPMPVGQQRRRETGPESARTRGSGRAVKVPPGRGHRHAVGGHGVFQGRQPQGIRIGPSLSSATAGRAAAWRES
jgi:hypothetical protein